MSEPQARAGIYEFVFGAPVDERDELLAFWAVLGFVPVAEGSLDAATADRAYGHDSGLTSVRLVHPGCSSFGTGYVRLQFWERLRNEGLGNVAPVTIGSRWMGMYTHDILQLADSFASEQAHHHWGLWVSPLVSAPLMKPAPEVDFYNPFVGLRELLVFGNRFRLAFIQRGGFDRPGFGTFDDSLAYKNTEGSHANVVQPAGEFSTDFYKQAFGLETAPFGEAHDSGDDPATIAALNLKDGEMFRVERTRAVDCPAGLLQVYSSYVAGDDLRDRSRPGSGNVCAYSMRVRDLELLATTIEASDGARRGEAFEDEFGTAALSFDAPDGYAWIAVTDED